jgi:hypothetical protein
VSDAGGGADGRDAAPADRVNAPDGAADVAPPRDVAADAAPADAPPPADAAPDAATDQAPPSGLAVGLISRWKLDEGTGTMTADAVSETGNAGVITGATWITPGYPAAKYPNPGALRFDGMTSQVELGFRGMPALDQPQSVSLWMTYTAPAVSEVAFVFVNATTGRLKIGIKAANITMWRSGPAFMQAPGTPGWHHVVYTSDGTNQRLYVDGQSVDTTTRAPDTGAVAGARLGTQGAEHYKGDIDEVRVYNRVLSPAEVQALAAGME